MSPPCLHGPHSVGSCLQMWQREEFDSNCFAPFISSLCTFPQLPSFHDLTFSSIFRLFSHILMSTSRPGTYPPPSFWHLLCNTLNTSVQLNPWVSVISFLPFWPDYFFFSSHSSITKCKDINYWRHSCSWTKTEDFSPFPVYCTQHHRQETETSSSHGFQEAVFQYYLLPAYKTHYILSTLQSTKSFSFFPWKRRQEKKPKPLHKLWTCAQKTEGRGNN